MSDLAQQPSAAVQKLIDKFSAKLDVEQTASGRFAVLDTLLRVAMDPKKPSLPGSAESVFVHLRGCLVPVPMYGVHKIVAAFSLVFTAEGRKATLKTKSGDTLRLKEDDAFSSRHLIEAACVKLLLEYDNSRAVYPTFTIYSRSTHIEALAPYEGVSNQYVEYLSRLQIPVGQVIYTPLTEEQVIDTDTGLVIFTALEAGRAYALVDPDRSKMAEILIHCQKSGVNIRVELTKEWHVAEFLKSFSSLKKISSGAGRSVLAYEANTTPPSHPMVAGPESEIALLAVTTQIREWLSTGKAIFDASVFHQPEVEGKRAPKVALLFESMTIGTPPQEKEFPQIPGDVKTIYHEAIKRGPDGGRRYLDELGITNQNPIIHNLTSDSLRGLPKALSTMVGRVTCNMPNPGARLLLKYVHHVFTDVSIYKNNPQIKDKMPHQPWKAAVNLICRQMHRFGLDDAVSANGDYFPLKYAIQKNMVAAKTTGTKPKKHVAAEKPKQARPALPGVLGFRPKGSRGSNAYAPRPSHRNYVSDAQLAQFAQTSVNTMLAAQSNMPALYQEYPHSAGAYGTYSGASSNAGGDWNARNDC